MKSIIFVTQNDRKIQEARLGCGLLGITVEQAKLDIDEIQSHDPHEISRQKATAAFSQLHQPLVVTDTFWAIPAVNGFPGGYMKDVAQWFSSQNFLNLLAEKDDRRVSFTETITYIDATQTKTFAHEYWGLFVSSPRGTGNSIENVAEFDGVTLGERRQRGGFSHKPEEYIWYDFAKWFSPPPLPLR